MDCFFMVLIFCLFIRLFPMYIVYSPVSKSLTLFTQKTCYSSGHQAGESLAGH
jgi:hypothetical protein